MRKKFEDDAPSLSEEDRAYQAAEVEEQERKMKRRMLGNMRFIGELYKKSLLKSHIMYECFTQILLRKPLKDEDIELLCKLLHTVGSSLESKASSAKREKEKEEKKKLEELFDQIARLAADKSLNSRMRFALEEVIHLRQNNWQSRREQEGPLKLEEIHERIAKEAEIKKQQYMQQQQGPPGKRLDPRHGYQEEMSPRGREDFQQYQQQGGRYGGQAQGQGQGQGGFYGGRGVQFGRMGGAGPAGRRPEGHGYGPGGPGGDYGGRGGQYGRGPQDGPQRRPPGPPGYGAPAGQVSTPPYQPRDTGAGQSVKSVVEEMMHTGDIKDAAAQLSDVTSSSAASLFGVVIPKLLNISKSDQLEVMYKFLELILPRLIPFGEKIEETVLNCEEVSQISDIIVDFKQV